MVYELSKPIGWCCTDYKCGGHGYFSSCVIDPEVPKICPKCKVAETTLIHSREPIKEGGADKFKKY